MMEAEKSGTSSLPGLECLWCRGKQQLSASGWMQPQLSALVPRRGRGSRATQNPVLLLPTVDCFGWSPRLLNRKRRIMALVKSVGIRVAAAACLLVLLSSILHAEEKTWRISI